MNSNKDLKDKGIPQAKDPRAESKEYCPVCGKVVEKGIYCGNTNCPYKNIALYS